MSESTKTEMTNEERRALALRLADEGRDMIVALLEQVETKARAVSDDVRQQNAATVAYLGQVTASLIATTYLATPPSLRQTIMADLNRTARDLILAMGREIPRMTAQEEAGAGTFRAPGSKAIN